MAAHVRAGTHGGAPLSAIVRSGPTCVRGAADQAVGDPRPRLRELPDSERSPTASGTSIAERGDAHVSGRPDVGKRSDAKSTATCMPIPNALRCARLSLGGRPARRGLNSRTPEKELPRQMSHHLDTPLAAQNGQLFIDDLYVFQGEASTVFVMDVNSNITGVFAQPGFHPEARYEFKIHFDGANFETLMYRVAFGEPDSDGRQSVQVHALTGADAREDSAIGDRIAQGRTSEAVNGDGLRLWTGRIADSFYIDLSLLSIVNAAIKNGTAVDLSAWHPSEAKNSFANTTVETMVLEISHQHPLLRPGANIGVWGAAKLATDAVGGGSQSRRAPHDVADLLTGRHPLHGTRPTPRHPSEDERQRVRTLPSMSPRRSRPARRLTIRGGTASLSRGGSFQMSCRTWWARRRAMASPPSTVGRLRTTRPR